MKMKVEFSIQSLYNSIELLKKKKIDESFKISQKTLFEFVDEEAVNELISKIQQFIKDMKVKKNKNIKK